MQEFEGSQEREVTRGKTPYEKARSAVQKIRSVEGAEQVKDLVTWFPTPERQKEIQASDPDAQAEFVARAFGRTTDWDDAVGMLDMWRPQDGGTAGDDLGLTQEQSFALVPATRKVTYAVEHYIDDMVKHNLHDNLPLVASHLQTFGQAVGFRSMEMSRYYSDHKEPAEIDITLPDGSTQGCFFLS